MPLYFFDVRDKDRDLVDSVGVECADVAAARAEAIATAGEMIRDKTRDFSQCQTWNMKVRGEQNTVLFELSFSARWGGGRRCAGRLG